MDTSDSKTGHVYKTARFAKKVTRAGIIDDGLCDAIRQVALGQVTDLGGGVFKKRLGNNRYRGIILEKLAVCAGFTFLYLRRKIEGT